MIKILASAKSIKLDKPMNAIFRRRSVSERVRIITHINDGRYRYYDDDLLNISSSDIPVIVTHQLFLRKIKDRNRRDFLIIITPTGTTWADYNEIEFLDQDTR